jgi:hypothetical protein
MESGPPKVIEILVWMVLPPACRESVVGDLRERYRSTPQYIRDAISSVPLVIVSRIRRTADPRLLLLEALTLYLAFLTSGRFADDAQFLYQPNAYLRLAVPGLAALLALVLLDAYASTQNRLIYGPVAAMAGIWIQSKLTGAHPAWGLPPHVLVYATGLGLLLVGCLRILSRPGDHRTTGAR